MTSIEAGSTKVLKAFIADANAQYREAGLSEYQLKVNSDGSVNAPNRPKAGNAAQAKAAVKQAKAAAANTSASSPLISSVQNTAPDTIQINWQADPSASSYGIYQDGKLIGSVPNPQFSAKIAADTTGTIQIDIVRADGSRSDKSQPIAVIRKGNNPVEAQAISNSAPVADAKEGAAQ